MRQRNEKKKTYTKRKHTPNETIDYLREATKKECELKKEELEFRKKQEERALAQKNLMFQQQQEMSRQFQDQLKNQQQQFQMMCQTFMQQQQQQSQALLEILKRDIGKGIDFFVVFVIHTKLQWRSKVLGPFR